MTLRKWIVAPGRRQVLTTSLVVLAVVAALIVGPGIRASGDLQEVGALSLGSDNSLVQAVTRGDVSEDENGYRVGGDGQATVTVPLSLPTPREGRTLVRIWAYGPEGVTTTVVLNSADGAERTLGQPGQWVGETFDVSREARSGTARLRVTSENTLDDSVLFFDRVAPVAAPDSATVTASAWSVGLLVLLTSSALLALAGRIHRHWPLPLVLAGTAGLIWSEILDKSLEPLAPDVAATWNAATEASWFGFHDGLLWGSWQTLSSLGVQVLHAFTPIVGTAAVSARSASLLAALVALAAVYAFGNRAAGRLGGLVAIGLAIAATPFRDAAIAGSTLPVLVLAGALLGYSIHACLAQATPLAIVLLAGGVTIVTLADPAWLPGGLAVIAIVAAACGEKGQRLRVLGIGLLATFVLLTPHLASSAAQNDGSLFSNMSARAIAARNAEFQGAGHGSPTPLELATDPLGGRPVTLPGYLFGDHSVSQFIGGVLSGGQESLAAFGEASGPLAIGGLAFGLAVIGVLYVLILPRLRLLVLLPPLVAAPTLFIASRTDADPLAAGAVIWPPMLVCAGILAYAVVSLARPTVEPRLATLRHLRTRLTPPRSRRRPSAAAPTVVRTESSSRYVATPGQRGPSEQDP